MISGREVAIGIYGAWRLLNFDRGALSLFDTTDNGFWKSFYAALVVLPAAMLLRILFLAINPDIVADAGASRVTLVFLLDYVFQWTLFPLLMVHIANGMGRSRQFVPFMVAHNWSIVIQVAIILPAATLFLLGGSTEQPGLGGLVLLAAHIIAWIYGWFIARAALDISGMAAAVIILIEFALGVLVSLTGESLLRAI